MLVTISMVSTHLKAAEEELNVAGNYLSTNEPDMAVAAAAIAQTHVTLARAYMFARETLLAYNNPNPPEDGLPF